MTGIDDGLPTAIHPDGWRDPTGYSHGMTASGRVIVTAGQVGWDPATNAFVSDEFVEQCAQALRNVVSVLRSSGAETRHIVRLTWFVVDRDEYLVARAALGAAYREILGRHFPAMTVVVVNALLEPRARVEIEATAVVP